MGLKAGGGERALGVNKVRGGETLFLFAGGGWMVDVVYVAPSVHPKKACYIYIFYRV